MENGAFALLEQMQILWKKEHLLKKKSKCSIFHIFKSIQIFLRFFSMLSKKSLKSKIGTALFFYLLDSEVNKT